MQLAIQKTKRKRKQIFRDQIEKEIKATPRTVNPKIVRTMKNFQAFCKENVRKIAEQVGKDKVTKN